MNPSFRGSRLDADHPEKGVLFARQFTVQGLVNSPNLPKLPRGGIYRLVALTEDDLALRGVNRVCGRDNHGTLYIGRSHNLRMRLSTIARELCARHRGERFYVEGHTVGWLTRHGLLARTFPVNSLALTWSFNKNPLKAEANLLRHYFQSFGEGPPLKSRLYHPV